MAAPREEEKIFLCCGQEGGKVFNQEVPISATTLDLGGNKLTTLPPEIGRLINLKTLILYGNQLTTLPPEIGHLINLTTLNLSGNHLTTLPPEIGRLTNLTTLNLHGNQLTTLPPEIGLLVNLTMLNLSGNQLATLPPEIGRLINLTTLDLSDNQLTTLPPEIGRLINLTTLILSDNQLTTLPPEIGRLINLITLILFSNPIIDSPFHRELASRIRAQNPHQQASQRTLYSQLLEELFPSKISNTGHFPRALLSQSLEEALRSDILDRVEAGNEIGGGNFGKVFKGTWNGKEVALKFITDPGHSSLFQREAVTMRALRHLNIVRYFGLADCQLNGSSSRCIVMELARGCVRDLVRNRGLGAELLKVIVLRAIVDTAAAMSYLASIPVVHCDLAARNLLFFLDGCSFTTKVADVGLARVLRGARDSKALFPWKSTAPEVLGRQDLSERSDVWSFGILLWELLSRCSVPYVDEGIHSDSVLEFLSSGKRLQKPSGCSEEFYSLMLDCWKMDPAARPSFIDICFRLRDLCSSIRCTLIQDERASPLDSSKTCKVFTVSAPDLEESQIDLTKQVLAASSGRLESSVTDASSPPPAPQPYTLAAGYEGQLNP